MGTRPAVAIHAVSTGRQPWDALLWDMDGKLARGEPVDKLAFERGGRSLGVELPGGFHDTVLGQGAD